MAAAPPFDVVAFDCDSTLSTLEGVDELGRDVPGVAELTARAMGGEVPLEDVFALRMERIAPDRTAIDALGLRYVETAVDGAREVVRALQALGKRVAIVSGGLRPAILPLAAHLGVDERDVHAVDVCFGPGGAYAGFEADSPLARSGGKPEIARLLAAHGRLAFVGDGVTDLEARSVADAFIAFAGVERRETVVSGADAVVEERSLLPLAALLFTAEERARLQALGFDAPLAEARP